MISVINQAKRPPASNAAGSTLRNNFVRGLRRVKMHPRAAPAYTAGNLRPGWGTAREAGATRDRCPCVLVKPSAKSQTGFGSGSYPRPHGSGDVPSTSRTAQIPDLPILLSAELKPRFSGFWGFSPSHPCFVGAPAFMRGKERFSAPRNSLDSIMRFSAGKARAVLYGLYRLRNTRSCIRARR